MPRAPLKKKTAAVFSAFIKYSCCSLEKKKDPLPEKKDIFSITLWWLHIFLCLKAMSFFDWDPEKKIKRGREKSQTGRGRREEPALAPAVWLQWGGRIGSSNQQEQRCRSDSASSCGRRAWQQSPPFPLSSSCRRLQPSQTHFHGELIHSCLEINNHKCHSPPIAFPEHPWDPIPLGLLQREHQSCCTPSLIFPLQSGDATVFPRSCRKAINSHSATFTSYSLGAAEQLIALPLPQPVWFLHSCTTPPSITCTGWKRNKRAKEYYIYRPTWLKLLSCRRYVTKVHVGKASHALFQLLGEEGQLQAEKLTSLMQTGVGNSPSHSHCRRGLSSCNLDSVGKSTLCPQMLSCKECSTWQRLWEAKKRSVNGTEPTHLLLSPLLISYKVCPDWHAPYLSIPDLIPSSQMLFIFGEGLIDAPHCPISLSGCISNATPGKKIIPIPWVLLSPAPFCCIISSYFGESFT